MLIAKVLNSSATLNNFKELSSVEFIPGEEINMVVRLHDTQLDLRYIPASTCVTTFKLNKSDGTELSVTGTHNADDRSLISFSLTEVQSATLIGGNINFELDILGNGTQIIKGIIRNAMARVLDGSEC